MRGVAEQVQEGVQSTADIDWKRVILQGNETLQKENITQHMGDVKRQTERCVQCFYTCSCILYCHAAKCIFVS